MRPFSLADEHAIEFTATLEGEEQEQHAMNGAWRLIMWPLKAGFTSFPAAK